MAWERGAGKGREGAEGVDVDYALRYAWWMRMRKIQVMTNERPNALHA